MTTYSDDLWAGRGGRIDRALVSRAGDRGFKPWSTYQIDTCHFLAKSAQHY